MAIGFGKYELVRKLGSGGMGEVFLARRRGAAEANGRIVIKRILPHLTANSRFLKLFLDEAKLAARLSHPNIVRIFELDEVDGAWFVGMEYVAGRDLREVMRRANEKNVQVPVGVACKVAMEVASGLDYAHRSTDPSGRPLKLVHRDVSPHNILLGFDGSVKLIDFGVAKAANKAVHTATGVLKGKFPYMSPEQAEGKRIDRRADVFALGIVLWEMLTGRYLFRGKSDAATLKAVKACQVRPPSELNVRAPKDLDAIVLRALARQPQERFQDASELKATLLEFLAVHPGLNKRSDVGAFVKKLFPQDVDADDLEELTDEDELWTPTDEGDESSITAELLGSDDQTRTIDGRRRKRPPVRPMKTDEYRATASLLEKVSQRPTNLARQETSFVGRVAELAELHQLLRQGSRLLTLIGPGGTGKTRLAIQLASQVLSLFKGGVWFCDLTEATDLDGVCVGLSRALDAPLPAGKSSQDSVAHLGHVLNARGAVLVVLDNLEQVVADAAAAVEQWMRSAPKARFLATSREVLRVPHEVVFEVPPLKVPQAGEDVRSSEAVMLFVARARSARPRWQPTAADEQAIAEVVRQLEGLPLAIELAAARMSVLTPSQLVSRLPRRFDLLAGGAPQRTARQATLRNAIEWSWNLLQPYEQSALAQCAVFRGGFTAEAAEAVVDLSAFPDAPEVLSCVMTLRAKSLVRSYVAPGTESQLRYGLFDSIREFAVEKLKQMPEAEKAHERHARFFIELGSRYSVGAESNAQLLDGLALERENLYAVFQRGMEPDADPKARHQALKAVLALDPLLSLRGPFSAHLLMLDAAIERAFDAEPLLKALAHEARGKARQGRWRLNDAAADYAEMLRLAQQMGDSALEGRARYCLGAVYRLTGRQDDAWAEFQHALVLLKEFGDRRMEGRTIATQGMMHQENGKVTEALAKYVEALEILREVGDRRFEGIILSNLGVLQQQQGLLGQAKQHYEAALAIHRELGNRRSEGIALLNLGDLYRDQEEPPLAMAQYEKALAIHREVGNKRFEGIVVAAMGGVDHECGRLREAAAKYRTAEALLHEVGDSRYEGLVVAARAAVDALEGRQEEAEAAIEQADALLSEAGDQAFLDAASIYRAHVEFAASVRASEAKDEKRSAELERRVAERVRRAERATPPDSAHPGGGPSPAERSEHVRAALRCLRAAMRRGVR